MNLLDELLNLKSDDGPVYQRFLNTRDYTGAVPHLRSAAAADDPTAMAVLGGFFAMGRGVQKDPQEAYLWFRQAASRNNLFGQAALGVCLASGFGTPVNMNEAAFWLYKAGKRGHRGSVDVLAGLANKHHEIIGEHFSEDELIALTLARKADAKMRREAANLESTGKAVH